MTRVPLHSSRRAEHTMGMPQTAHFWTPDEVRGLPDDGRRYEVIAGELLVTPAPAFPHQEAVLTLVRALSDYLDKTKVGHAAISPADLTPEPGALVQPDAFVVGLVGGRRPRQWADIERLLLAIEVLSPSTARADRSVKRRLYQRAGVEYWIVDLEARLVERWRPRDERPEILTDQIDWIPEPGTAPLTIDLQGFFGRVFDERRLNPP
jgi:Uma2 family endonuclease